MNRLSTLTLLTSTLLLGFALAYGDALAQQKSLKEQLVGTWTIVTSDNINCTFRIFFIVYHALIFPPNKQLFSVLPMLKPLRR